MHSLNWKVSSGPTLRNLKFELTNFLILQLADNR